jgi:2,2-dialkylglycine decarboxylase (pyruvate)
MTTTSPLSVTGHDEADAAGTSGFWSDVQTHLVRYGGSFTPEIIDHAQGSFLTPRAAGGSSTSPPVR